MKSHFISKFALILITFGIASATIQPAMGAEDAVQVAAMKSQYNDLVQRNDELRMQKNFMDLEFARLRQLPRTHGNHKKVMQLVMQIRENSDQAQALRLETLSLNHEIIMSSLEAGSSSEAVNFAQSESAPEQRL